MLISLDPATGAEVWRGETAGPAECAAAVGRARVAGRAWSARPLAERIAVLQDYAALLDKRSTALAEAISRETGKPLRESRGEVASMVGKIGLSITAQAERAGERTTATAFGSATLRHRPHGVMAVFGPYNFPGHLPNGHIVPALLAGNAVVFKPSEQTPWVGELLVQALHDAGVPGDVVQIVQGDRATGEALIACDIDGVLFTGSAATGRAIRLALVDRPNVIVALELGGNNPLIAWDGPAGGVADLVIESAFITTGQRCTCARRLIVPNGAVGDGFVTAIAARMSALRIGQWDETPEPFMGPLINARATEAALKAQDAMVRAGANAVVPMVPVAGRSEAFVSPGLIDVTGVPVPDHEIFAPLLSILRVDSFDQAIEHANRTAYGLAAGLISEDDDLWARFANEARAGVVNRNRPTTGASGAMPFGGIGESGNHRPSAFYAADYCAYPVASLEAARIEPPA